MKNLFTVRVVKHQNRLPRGIGELPSVEIPRTCLSFEQGAWARQSLEVPSNLSHSVIL